MKYFFSSIVLAIGIAFAGHFVANALIAQKTAQRLITVKGLAEKYVQADTGTWYIGFSATSNGFNAALSGIETSQTAVTEFLKQYGIVHTDGNLQEQVVLSNFAITDTQTQTWNSNKGGKRFIINAGIQVRTNNLQALQKASLNVSALAKSGVILTSNNAPNYTFSKLNDIKPDMLAQSIRSARTAADSLAVEAGSNITALYSAHQGFFDISGADSSLDGSSQIAKKVRVVSTVQYYVE